MRSRHYLIFLFLGVIVIAGSMAGCIRNTNTVKGQTIVVCSGAGLMKPMNELIRLFENKTGIKVEVHYGGSGEIFGVLQTTGCDVFIPGAWYYMQQAMKKGYILDSTVKNVTYHIPVIAVPKGNPKGIHSLKDLAKPGVRVVLGDPRACAIGRVAKKILEKNGLWVKVKPNIVTFAPTVNQLIVYITTGQADAAIIWEDMTTWAQSKGKIEVIKIPRKQNIIKTIPTAVTIYAKKDGHLEAAKAFNNFIANHTKIWEKWGFKPWNG
ncbi:MAG: molybdate ABC transporter substrate-binding protein [Archaeoglobus sp.]|nr:MAG: molybdate ABC transporter substrate-binding protein [Archaeoglobus sp.]